MTVYFKDPAGLIRLLQWNIDSPKPFKAQEILFVGMISVSLVEAQTIHDAFDHIPKLKNLPATGEVHWYDGWARFILSNL